MGRIAQWSFVQFLGLGVVLTALYYFIFFDDGSNLDNQIRQAQSTLEAKSAELATLQKAESEKEKVEEEMNLIAEQFKSVLQYLPTEFNQAELMRDVIDEARIAGTRNIKIQPQLKDVKGPFYESLFIEINFESSFAQAASFLSAVTRIPRIINVDQLELEMKANEKSQLLSVHSTLIGYRYVEQSPPKQEGQ